jgi:hypothetical protein
MPIVIVPTEIMSIEKPSTRPEFRAHEDSGRTERKLDFPLAARTGVEADFNTSQIRAI